MSATRNVVQIDQETSESIRMILALAIGFVEGAESRGITGITTYTDEQKDVFIPNATVIHFLEKIIHLFEGPKP